MLAAKTSSSTTAQATLRAPVWAAAVVCSWLARVGRQGGDGQEGQAGDIAGRLGLERLGAVAQAAEEEGQPEHQQAVAQHRAHQRGLHDGDLIGSFAQQRRCR